MGGMSTQFVPWNSIRESLVDFGERRLRYPQGLASPCLTCRTAPCCTHLRVQTFRASKLMECLSLPVPRPAGFHLRRA